MAASAEVKLHFSGSSELKCEIGSLDTACVKWEVLGNMIAKKPPRWQPDLSDWRLKRSGISKLLNWQAAPILARHFASMMFPHLSASVVRCCFIHNLSYDLQFAYNEELEQFYLSCPTEINKSVLSCPVETSHSLIT